MASGKSRKFVKYHTETSIVLTKFVETLTEIILSVQLTCYI